MLFRSSPQLRRLLGTYLTIQHGVLLTSGAYIASDAQHNDEQQWLSSHLKISLGGTNIDQVNEQMTGLGSTFSVYRQLNSRHYAAWRPDVLTPTGAAFGAMQYADGRMAAVAYQGNDYRTFTMAIPFECIKDASKRNALMGAILNFLLPNQKTIKK